MWNGTYWSYDSGDSSITFDSGQRGSTNRDGMEFRFYLDSMPRTSNLDTIIVEITLRMHNAALYDIEFYPSSIAPRRMYSRSSGELAKYQQIVNAQGKDTTFRKQYVLSKVWGVPYLRIGSGWIDTALTEDFQITVKSIKYYNTETDVWIAPTVTREEQLVYERGFNGMHKVDELKGDGLHYTTEFREYNPKTGRWGAVDLLTGHQNQIGLSPYSSFWNNPLYYNDQNGLCPTCPTGEEAKDTYAEGAIVENKDGKWRFNDGKWIDVNKEWNKKIADADNVIERVRLRRKSHGINDDVTYDKKFWNDYQKFIDYGLSYLDVALTVSTMGIGGSRGGLSSGTRYLDNAASAINKVDDVVKASNEIDDMIILYSKSTSGLTQAPRGGITNIASGKYYSFGSPTPKARLHFGKGGFQDYKTLDPNSTMLRPTPMNSHAAPVLRWGAAIGGSSAAGFYYWNKMMNNGGKPND